MLILIVIALSRVIDQAELLGHRRPLSRLAGGPANRRRWLCVSWRISLRSSRRARPGWLLLTMLFFSSLRVHRAGETRCRLIFLHRVEGAAAAIFMISAAGCPYCYIFFLARSAS